ncbi:Jas TPL-binding domain [Sesbania bispinosa]|nr:Jas TPL-binding domain [Sesbania bispinosa]
MVEVEEIELDLGLSIGGTFRKPVEKPKPAVLHSDPNGMQRVDPHAKREIQALRRMEAKKKREQKRGTSRDRVGESEPEYQRPFKREKTDFMDGVMSGTTVSWTAPFRVQQPHPYATVQYVPLNNGFALPCWVTSEKNVGGLDGVNGVDGKAKSNGSSRCSSSAVSDYQSSSREDGGSTDSRSYSANSFAELTQLSSSKEINMRSQPEESASSHPMGSKQGNNEQERKDTEKETQPNNTQPEPMKVKEEAATTNSKALPRPIDNANTSNCPLKPPKPLSQTSSLPQMPYVSTKGNGPNGKIVNGFLYRYNKSEVSIVCVCHGSTFSPAEFVQHAGGTDISHPLRHITVIPSAFG